MPSEDGPKVQVMEYGDHPLDPPEAQGHGCYRKLYLRPLPIVCYVRCPCGGEAVDAVSFGYTLLPRCTEGSAWSRLANCGLGLFCYKGVAGPDGGYTICEANLHGVLFGVGPMPCKCGLLGVHICTACRR